MPSEVAAYGKILPLVGKYHPQHPTKSEVTDTAFVVAEDVSIT
jgi:hypothetical protein